jgi:hypothetical protein
MKVRKTMRSGREDLVIVGEGTGREDRETARGRIGSNNNKLLKMMV